MSTEQDAQRVEASNVGAMPKSVLSGIPVKESEPVPVGTTGTFKTSMSFLSIVGHCHCGAPVYGKMLVAEDDVPVVRYSCNCYRSSRNIMQQCEQK